MTSPLSIFNPPGLAAIQYRCGDFTSFRQAMLNRVAEPDLLASAVTTLLVDAATTDNQIAVADAVNFPISEPFRIKIGAEYMSVVSGAGTPVWKVLRGPSPALHNQGTAVILDPENPFLTWHEGIDSDYQTMFVELWAYLGDILTFYQERIANEAFAGTATQRDSLMRLTELIGYRPSPGAGAAGLVAFTVAKGQTVSVPAGFRVGSRALPGKPAVTYETSTAITATADNSLLTMAARSARVPYQPGTVVIHGVNTKLKPNDFLLAVENAGKANELAHLLRVDAVAPDPAENFTTLSWHDAAGIFTQAGKDLALYSFGVTAAPLGHIAPRWEFISPLFTNIDGQHPGRVLFENARWDFPFLFEASQLNPWYYIPSPGEPGDVLHLDALYEKLNYTPAKPGWAVLHTDGGIFQILHVTDARPTGKTAYALSSKSTRLTFAEFMFPLTFPFRNTRVFTGVEPLPLETDLPLPQTLSGNTLALAGIHTQLQPGQTVMVRGALAAAGTIAVESAIVSDPVQTDSADNVTFVKLKQPLANAYRRPTCSLLANIVEVTQGETVKDEVLGSGNGAAFQAFALAQHPLTYLPSTDPEGLSAVQSSLTVTVNNVAWTERRNLAASDPRAQEFSTALDDSGQTSVVFGDGFHGARPPSGANNIRARYRKGLGNSGNLAAGAIQQLVDGAPNLQKVTNPAPASGGSDAETSAEIRAHAPSSLRTFGRAVSASDYAALAIGYPGIAKARAAWASNDPISGMAVAQPYVLLTVAAGDRVPVQGTGMAGKLRRFLDNHRDPNVPLRIQDFLPVYLQVAVSVEIDSRFPHNATLARVRAALNPGINPDGSFGYFFFERLQFGQTLYLSDLYAAIQSLDGIRDSTVTTLLRLGPNFPDAPSSAPHDILIGPAEIAAIDPAAFQGSSLTITAQGGFADQ